MPRKNRTEYVGDDCVVHVRMQINNGEFHFKRDSHFKLWRSIALRYLRQYSSIKITVYQWMNSHYHLILEMQYRLFGETMTDREEKFWKEKLKHWDLKTNAKRVWEYLKLTKGG